MRTAKEILSSVDATDRRDLVNRIMSRSSNVTELARAQYDVYSQTGKANIPEALELTQSAFDTLQEYDAACQREA
jgi:hypothetical protein